MITAVLWWTTGSAEILEGRHPVVEQVLKGAPFVPNDAPAWIAMLTGALITTRSQYGGQIHLYASKCADCADGAVALLCAGPSMSFGRGGCQIYTRIGASDDLAAGQSTFMVEMTEVAEII